MFYYNLTTVFMRNKTVMSDNLQAIEDKLKQYDVSSISKSGRSLAGATSHLIANIFKAIV